MSFPFPYGVTQPLTRILRKHDIQVVNKPLKTLQQEFPSPKFRPSIEHQPNVVYKIPCADCDWCYIGETGRCFETRKKKYTRNVKTCANGSKIAKHAWSFDYRIDFDNSSVIDKGSFRIRKTLEAWHISATKHTDNNSKPNPDLQYSILFKQYSTNLHVYTLLLFFSWYFIWPLCAYISPFRISFFIRRRL